MKKFDGQLLRLKELLGVAEDQQVAALFGMSKQAFADRKRRDAFPEDKLYALKAKLPELDDFYVVTGERRTSNERLMHDAMARAAVAAGDRDLAKSAATAAQNMVEMERRAMDSPLMRRLVHLAMFCSDDDVEALCRAALRMAPVVRVPVLERAEKLPPPSHPTVGAVGATATVVSTSRRPKDAKPTKADATPTALPSPRRAEAKRRARGNEP